jgi:pimeloyl-ACP methyl ester carboxylesterase
VISRRDLGRFVGIAAAGGTVAACATGQRTASAQPEGRNGFQGITQIAAGDLDIGYAEEGPSDGRPVILLHGWPYDIHSYVDVAPILAQRGFRVIVPYLRGFGSTSFQSATTVRNGQQAALASDVIALMDALDIPDAIIGGFDWGAR